MTKRTPLPASDELTRRAFAAYFRSPDGTEQLQAGSVLAEHDGKEYVILSSTNGPLAVYRLRTDGILKRLKRWPADIEGKK